MIKPSLKKRILMRGTVLAATGLIPIFYGSLFLGEKTLSTWGLPIFFLGLGLITLGMLPYRRLTRLEKHPDKLVVMADDTIHYYRRGKNPFTIPFSSIETISYMENGNNYGVRIHLKKEWMETEKKTFKRQIFFPYFSRKMVEQMINTVTAIT